MQIKFYRNTATAIIFIMFMAAVPRIEFLQWQSYGLQSLKSLLHGPLQEKHHPARAGEEFLSLLVA